MATYSTTGTSFSANPTQELPEKNSASYRHLNDSLKTTDKINISDSFSNFVPNTILLNGRAVQHKTLLSTLYAAQDQYILDVWTTEDSGETTIHVLSNSKTTKHFVFLRDSDGKTYTSIVDSNDSYQTSFVPPITPTEVYAATPSRVLYITDADNFTPSHVLSSDYTFGSICDTTDLQNQLNDCLSQKAALQDQLNQCQTDLSNCQSQLSACQNDLNTCQNDLSTCQGDLSTCQGDLSTCQGDLNTCSTNLSTCQGDLNTCNTNYANCQDNLNTCNANLTDCQNTVATQQNTINSLNNQINDLQNQIINYQNQINDLNNQIALLQSALADCQASSNPIVAITSHTITEKYHGILVQLTTEHNADIYLFVKNKATNEIVKIVQSPFTGTQHTLFIPLKESGQYVIDYLSLKHV